MCERVTTKCDIIVPYCLHHVDCRCAVVQIYCHVAMLDVAIIINISCRRCGKAMPDSILFLIIMYLIISVVPCHVDLTAMYGRKTVHGLCSSILTPPDCGYELFLCDVSYYL